MKGNRAIYATILIVLYLSLNAVAQTKQDVSNAPVVDYCDLIREPALYDQKLIRVRTFYMVGFEASLFNKLDCRGKDVWVRFDSSFEKRTKSKILKKFNRLTDTSPNKKSDSGYQTRMIEVLAVGRFEGVKPTVKIGNVTRSRGFGHLGAYDFQFTVFAIEEVNSLPISARRNRVPAACFLIVSKGN